MLQITINASVRPVFYSGRYATGNIPTNHPCLATFYGSSQFGGWHHFFKLAFPPLTLTSLVLPVSLILLNRPTDGATVHAAQGRLNQKATLIRPFQFSIFPYKLCFCDISGGRTFLRSIYRFRTQSIETFPLFILRLSA
jgi:hypothetical protein